MAIIEVSKLSKTYSIENLQTRAVDSISFRIEEGGIVGLLGPNGAGKTTILKLLTGLLFQKVERLKVLNFIPWERKNELRRQISFIMGQKEQLWWDLPSTKSFILNKEIYGIEDRSFTERLENLSELLNVKDLLNIQIRKLSLDERMKMENNWHLITLTKSSILR